jgi:acetyl esterase/lipase
MSRLSSERAEVAAAIRKLGRKFDPEVLQATYAIYRPVQERAPKDAVEVHRELAYGEHARHRLDIHAPVSRPAKAPIVIYFHGGGYVSGERSPIPGLIYDNVATFFARHGMIGVNATYRLAPEYKWPSGGADVGAAVVWLRENVSRFGGDPDRIFIMGQSAGGTHVATWTFIPQVHGPLGPRVAGTILLSSVLGPCDPEYSPERPIAPHRLAYFGEDESQWAAMNPINHVKAGHPPVFISVTEFDPPPLQWSSPALLAALYRCDRKMPWFMHNRDHNHVSPAMQINAAFDDIGPEILAFVQSLL